MADSTPTKLLQQVPRFNGTNWESWAFSAKAVLLFLNALRITDGTEIQQAVPPANQATLDDWNKCAQQGLSLILVSVDATIHQLQDISKTLHENWQALTAQYGMCTGLSLWVDYRQYSQTQFLSDTLLTQQIDMKSELCA